VGGGELGADAVGDGDDVAGAPGLDRFQLGHLEAAPARARGERGAQTAVRGEGGDLAVQRQ
jgi:hypothetical protein